MEKKLAGNNFVSQMLLSIALEGGEAFQWFELTSVAPEKIGEGLEKAGPYLNNFIDNVSEIYNLENKKILFVGFSQGTMMALYHLCKRKKMRRFDWLFWPFIRK